MKLQNKINIRFLMVTLVVFAIAGMIFYFALGRVIDQNIREMLDSRKTNIISYLQRNVADSIPPASPDQSIYIRKIKKTENYTSISDTMVFDKVEKDMIHCRKMVFTLAVQDRHYEVTLLQSLLESEDLQALIIYFMVFLFSLILLALFFLNRWLSFKAWKPFFSSSAMLKSWKIGENKQVHFDKTGISEFDHLNRTLEEMIEKMQSDFVNLKEFTENASHEIQTPLAIIKSKIELLLNDPVLNQKQHKQLHDVFETVIRLSKLNEALLLLSKIENRQFDEKSEIDLTSLIKSRLIYLEELFELKQIGLSTNLDHPFIVAIHPMLAEILIDNLLGNALKHNHHHGRIIVTSEMTNIIFENTGPSLTFDPQKIFNRFVKQSTSMASNGMGLAIADEICKSNQLTLEYSNNNELHRFKLSKKEDAKNLQ
ncbi:MAG: HAMP domain-containing sensor histidine kinase [Prolixibacteraceae bacterium]